jgi:hypothetical protein
MVEILNFVVAQNSGGRKSRILVSMGTFGSGKFD